MLHALCKQKPYISGLRLSRNFRKEAALLAGLEHTNSQAVITLDADLQHSPALIPEILTAWQSGAQVVHGIKRERGDQFLHSYFASIFYNFMSKQSGFDMRNSSDYKLLDKKVVQHLIEQFLERGQFFRGLSHWVGYQQTELLFDVAPRCTGKTHWNNVQLLRYAIDNMTAYSALPLQILPFRALSCWSCRFS